MLLGHYQRKLHRLLVQTIVHFLVFDKDFAMHFSVERSAFTTVQPPKAKFQFQNADYRSASSFFKSWFRSWAKSPWRYASFILHRKTFKIYYKLLRYPNKQEATIWDKRYIIIAGLKAMITAKGLRCSSVARHGGCTSSCIFMRSHFPQAIP